MEIYISYILKSDIYSVFYNSKMVLVILDNFFYTVELK